MDKPEENIDAYAENEERRRKEEKEKLFEMEERCFEETYPGDSRKWLLRDPTWSKDDPPIPSTMKDTYQYPIFETMTPLVGRRKEILKRKLLEEVEAQIIKERSQPPPVEEYCTEYDGNYNGDGFKVPENEHAPNPELWEKYRLYGRQYTTYYTEKLRAGKTASFTGLTKALDPKNPFKRHSAFSNSFFLGSDEADAF